MSTEQAVYTLAHENGIDLSKYLSKDETTQVRALVAQLVLRRLPRRRRCRRRGRRASATEACGGNDRRHHHRRDPEPEGLAREGGEGNGGARLPDDLPLRELRQGHHRGVLSAEHGPDWWNVAVSPKVREKAEQFKKDEAKGTWHGKRGRRASTTYSSRSFGRSSATGEDFKPCPSRACVGAVPDRERHERFAQSGCTMNPLEEDDIKGLEVKFRKWSSISRPLKTCCRSGLDSFSGGGVRGGSAIAPAVRPHR